MREVIQKTQIEFKWCGRVPPWRGANWSVKLFLAWCGSACSKYPSTIVMQLLNHALDPVKYHPISTLDRRGQVRRVDMGVVHNVHDSILRRCFDRYSFLWCINAEDATSVRDKRQADHRKALIRTDCSMATKASFRALILTGSSSACEMCAIESMSSKERRSRPELSVQRYKEQSVDEEETPLRDCEGTNTGTTPVIYLETRMLSGHVGAPPP